MSLKQINVVFQGGGVRGIAHVGVMKHLEGQGSIEVVGVGGSSVGAIIASLLAAGYSARQIEEQMKSKPLHTLVGPVRMTLQQMLTESEHAGNTIQRVLEASKTWRGRVSIVTGALKQATSDIRRLSELAAAMQDLLRNFGLYDTKEIIKWLTALLESKGIVTIEDLMRKGSKKIRKFRILVSNVTHCTYREITEEHKSEHVAQVVGQSISIPLFFKPFASGQTYFVDGGMLSNYPLWLFEDSDDPTLGVRLRSKQDESLSYPIENFFDFTLALLWTMVGAHDKFRGIPRHCYALDVPTGDVKATDFELDERIVNELLTAGELQAAKIDWTRISPPAARNSYRELPEQAQYMLDDVLESAYDICVTRRAATDTEMIRYVRTLTIERDGTANREVVMEFKNLGDVPVMQRAYGVSELPHPMGFKELGFFAEDITPGKTSEQTVRFVPIKNSATEKHIGVFFTPPVFKGESRTVRMGCSIAGRYKSTLPYGKREEDGLNLTIAPGNQSIIRSVLYRIYVDKEVGALQWRELRPGGIKTVSSPTTSRYEEHQWEFRDLNALSFAVEFWIR